MTNVTFTFSDPQGNSYDVITTVPNADGSGAISSITGTVYASSGGSSPATPYAITGINTTYEGPDNTLGAGGSYDNNGFSFNVANGEQVNVFFSPNPQIIYTGGPGSNEPVSNYHATVTCFGSGTRIRTDRGDAAVEDLQVGDLATTSSGEHRPIRWLGHRTVDCRKHSRPREALPVRIAAHAFGHDRPARDLVVSPGHSICIDLLGEVLIPAGSLVNGSTIQQIEVDKVTYWHVELDSHDILLAENLPSESYLDCGNRSFFAEADVVALAYSPDARPATIADSCRPFVASGLVIDALRARLRTRAEALGWRLEHDDLGDMHLVVDRERIDGIRRGASVCFAVPPTARDVWLMSSAARPCDVTASMDSRRLGLSLRAISIVGGFETTSIPLDDVRLRDGFNRAEHNDAATWRWTTGRARLPADLWAATVGPTLLRIDVSAPALPRWVAPQDNVIASKRDHAVGESC